MWYLLLGIVLGIFIYLKIIKPTKYWEDRGITHEASLPVVGNSGGIILMKKHIMDLYMELYNKYSSERYVGFINFVYPTLMIRDLDLIKQITIKKFDHFHDHLVFSRSDQDPLLSKSLISLTGENWQRMRSTLSPVFTSGKMKIMYDLMRECAENFVGHFKGKEQVAVELKDLFSRYANDVIASTAFGINIDSLGETNNNFFVMGTRLIQFSTIKMVKLLLLSKFTFLVDLLGIRFFPSDITGFFRSIVKDNIKKRENNSIERPDLIQLLMKARKGQLKHEQKESKDEGFATVEESDMGKDFEQLSLTDDDIVAQAMLFFFAGFETASTASSFMAHELAVNPDIQTRLQKEIDLMNENCDGKISYEALLSMKYLDQVLSETLRLWPPGVQLGRVCTKDYIIEPKKDGEKRIVIEKGVAILIPVIAIHRDPQYYPEPNKFDPERFSDENKHKILPGSYIPFGSGPRNCIGSRFAILEIKTLFFHLLSKFDIVALNNTQIPLKIDKKKPNLMPKNGFRLGFRPRKTTFY